MPLNRVPEAVLMLAGLSVIVTGLVLLFIHQSYEFSFQTHLLDKLANDYHWHPIGDYYAGLPVVAIGALMMAFAAVIALREHR